MAAGLPETFLSTGGWAPSGGGAALSTGRAGFMDPTALGALSNPAALLLVGPGLSTGLSGALELETEKRTRTVYDEFGSSIGEAEHAFNRTVRLLPAGIAASLSEVSWLPPGLALGLGFRARGSFDYDYDRTINNDYYVPVGFEELTSSGMLGEIGLAAAFRVSGLLGVGVGGGLLSGSRDFTWSRDWIDPGITDEEVSESAELSGFAGRLSILLEPSPRLTVCAGAEQILSLGWSGGFEGDYDLPPEVSLGASWLPGNALRSRFTAEVAYRAMSGAELDGVDMGMDDAWHASAGIENHIPGGPVCRFGFRYDRSPVDRALNAASFTAGMGFTLPDGWTLDAGGSFTPRSWDQQDLPAMLSLDAGDSLMIEETRTTIVISASRAFSL